MQPHVTAQESALGNSGSPEHGPAAGTRRRWLIARGRLALGLVLVVGAGLWGTGMAAPAMAASPPGTITNYTGTGISGPTGLAAGSDGALTQTTYDVRAYIDGHSQLIISGSSAYWHHIDYSVPGYVTGGYVATNINGVDWYPTWPQPGQNVFCGCDSDSFNGVAPAVPADATGITYQIVSCRDSCSATYANRTLTIDFNDDPPPGAVWYEIQVTLTASPAPTPTSTAPPTISGSAVEGHTLVEAHGLWTNRPTSFTYQWEDCDRSGTRCEPIPGAASTTQTYTLTSSDVGDTIRVLESASNSSGTGGPAPSAATAIFQAGGPVGPVIVNELGLTGPSTSPGDQYVELYNRSGAPVSLDGWMLEWTSGQSSASVALGDMVLPAGGHYLLTGSGYLLSAVATPDQTATLPASLDGVSLVEPDGSTVSDSVGDVGSAEAWGTGLTGPVYPAGDSSRVAFVRRSARGAPVDTGDNQADSVLAAPDETAQDTPSYGQAPSDPPVLGTASPLDAGSPVQVNGVAQSFLLYAFEGESGSGNLAYTPPVSGPVSPSNPATLVIYRTIQNVSDQSLTPDTITQLQLRVAGLSTYGAGAVANPGDPTGAAVLSDVSSPDQSVSGPTDCNNDDQVVGATVAGTGDGGINSVLSVALPAGGLAPGGCVNVAIAFQVDQTGPFAVAYNVEDDLKPSTATSTTNATTAAAGIPMPAAHAPAPPALAGTVTPTAVTTTTTATLAKQAVHDKRARRGRRRHKHKARHATAHRHATTTVQSRRRSR